MIGAGRWCPVRRSRRFRLIRTPTLRRRRPPRGISPCRRCRWGPTRSGTEKKTSKRAFPAKGRGRAARHAVERQEPLPARVQKPPFKVFPRNGGGGFRKETVTTEIFPLSFLDAPDL